MRTATNLRCLESGPVTGESRTVARSIGDAVTVIGNRDRDPAEAHMKAVRIVIDGRNYDMYPERIQAD